MQADEALFFPRLNKISDNFTAADELVKVFLQVASDVTEMAERYYLPP
jgi:hypothetical protein